MSVKDYKTLIDTMKMFIDDSIIYLPDQQSARELIEACTGLYRTKVIPFDEIPDENFKNKIAVKLSKLEEN